MNHDGFLLEDKVIQSIPSLATDDVLNALASSERGLSTAEAQSRLASFGANELIKLKQRPIIFRFLENFYHLFAILLWVGGGMAFLADMPALGWAIFAVILINAVFSFWQE
ncbi:MAG: cation-transporting P-type ATPase, partial [Euryarchaeota archaeon]